MTDISLITNKEYGIDDNELKANIEASIKDKKGELKKVLLIPPDLTRMHSGAGKITGIYYNLLKDTCQVDIMPALGTHEPMTRRECEDFFGVQVPVESILKHDWRNDVIKIGQVSGEYVREISEGLLSDPIDVEVNRCILDKSYDLVISIGQVVPHEVVGMANYSKNIFVGCGGSRIISQSHMLGAVYGMEKIMGRDYSPVRKVFDYAEENFIKEVPLTYVLTVTSQHGEDIVMHGLFIGRDRKLFEQAVQLSQDKNLTYVEKPLKKVVVYLDEKEFKSTWLGNKAIYRTRMAIADGGELIVLAPGVEKFGEDRTNDALIREYGYVGRQKVLELCDENDDLKNNLSVAAHLIHGSTNGRFSITYAVDKMTRKEIEGVQFSYQKYEDAIKRYNPEKLHNGFNRLDDGEEVFYISNPALGLWAMKCQFAE